MRRPLHAALVALAVAGIALAAAPAATAHAVLVKTSPGNDSVLHASPERIVLRFSESVETAFGSVRVYAADARRVDDGRISRPDGDTVSAGIDGTLPSGTYTVAWRVISGDSHPVSGAFVFHVHEPGANPAGIAAEVLGGGTPRSVTVFFTVDRFLDFALLLLVAGGIAALALVLRAADARLRRRLFGAVAAAAVALAAVALVGIVLQGAAAGGFSVGDAARWSVVSQVLETRFGEVWLVQALTALALGAVAFVAARSRRAEQTAGAVALVLALVLVATPAAAGHASVSGRWSLADRKTHV